MYGICIIPNWPFSRICRKTAKSFCINLGESTVWISVSVSVATASVTCSGELALFGTGRIRQRRHMHPTGTGDAARFEFKRFRTKPAVGRIVFVVTFLPCGFLGSRSGQCPFLLHVYGVCLVFLHRKKQTASPPLPGWKNPRAFWLTESSTCAMPAKGYHTAHCDKDRTKKIEKSPPYLVLEYRDKATRRALRQNRMKLASGYKATKFAQDANPYRF